MYSNSAACIRVKRQRSSAEFLVSFMSIFAKGFAQFSPMHLFTAAPSRHTTMLGCYDVFSWQTVRYLMYRSKSNTHTFSLAELSETLCQRPVKLARGEAFQTCRLCLCHFIRTLYTEYCMRCVRGQRWKVTAAAAAVQMCLYQVYPYIIVQLVDRFDNTKT